MYYFIVLWLLICWKVCKKVELSQLVIAILPVFAMIAFRSETVGIDTLRYLDRFTSLDKNDTLVDLLNTWDTEKGYVVLCYILTQLDLGNQSLFITESLVFCGSIVFFCHNSAKDKLFVMLSTVLSLSVFALTGVRQTFALSLFLVAYWFAQEKRWLIYIILGCLAASFHTSALLVFPFAILINFKFNRRAITMYAVILIFSLLSINTIFYQVSTILSYEDYQLMSFQGGYISFIVSVLFGVVVFNMIKAEQKNKTFQQAAHYTILYALFSAIRFVNIMIMRVMLYLSVFPYLMIDTLDENKKTKRYKVLAVTYCVLYFLYNLYNDGSSYEFYWQ